MGGIVLRAAGSGDIPALARLAEDSFVAKFGHLYQPEDLSAFLEATYSPAAIAGELANPDRLYRLAERDGALIGYCKLGLTCGWPEHARGQRVIELKQLYTAPRTTGQGIGTMLMEWVFEEVSARGTDEVQLSVFSKNLGAQRFYRRHGFDKVADIFFWVGQHRDDEFLFARLF